MNEIAQKNETFALAPVLPRNEMQVVIDMVERVMLDKDLDFARVKEAMELLERIQARAAKMAFIEALARAQPKLPVIDQNGQIIIHNKEDRQKNVRNPRVEQRTKYAMWADIAEAITPVIAAEGLTLSFTNDGGAGGMISVTCLLRHIRGHEERTTLVLPHDSSGSKNPVQAIGSSLQYGKRYTAGLLLNFVSRAGPERDDDGKSSDERAQVIGEDKARELERALEACGADMNLFKEHFAIDDLAELPTPRLDEAVSMIARKTAKKTQAELANRDTQK